MSWIFFCYHVLEVCFSCRHLSHFGDSNAFRLKVDFKPPCILYQTIVKTILLVLTYLCTRSVSYRTMCTKELLYSHRKVFVKDDPGLYMQIIYSSSLLCFPIPSSENHSNEDYFSKPSGCCCHLPPLFLSSISMLPPAILRFLLTRGTLTGARERRRRCGCSLSRGRSVCGLADTAEQSWKLV